MQAIGLGAAIDYVESIGKARIRTHESGLVTYAHERLGEINSGVQTALAEERARLSEYGYPEDLPLPALWWAAGD